jgi:hypothetical protein
MFTPSSALLLAFLLAILAGATVEANRSAAALQSGPDQWSGNSKVVSVIYDPLEHSLLLVGNTVGAFWFGDDGGDEATSSLPSEESKSLIVNNKPTCFVAKLSLPVQGIFHQDMTWVHKQVLTESGSECELLGPSCTAAAADQSQNKLVLGVFDQDTSAGGVLELWGSPPLLSHWSDGSSRFGHTAVHAFTEEGFRNAVYNKPVAVSRAASTDALYVAVQVQEEGGDSEEKMVLRKYVVETTTTVQNGAQHRRKSLTADWMDALSVRGEMVEVVALISLDDENKLIVIGTESNTDGTNKNTFVQLIDAQTGSRIREMRDFKDDEVVASSCHHHVDSDHIYVTGWMQATSTKRAFLRKISAGTLQTVWSVEVEATGPTEGVACATHSSEIWWAGSVDAGKMITQAGDDVRGYGGKDVFVGKLRDGDGEIDFVRQVGSADDDEPAAVAVDAAGNAVVAGDTHGSMCRSRDTAESDHSDVFVVTVSRVDGATPSTVPPVSGGGSGDDDAVAGRRPADPAAGSGGGSTSQQTGRQNGGDAVTEPPFSRDADPFGQSFQEEKEKEKKMESITLVFVIVLLAGFFGCCCCYYFVVRCCRQRGRQGGSFPCESAREGRKNHCQQPQDGTFYASGYII